MIKSLLILVGLTAFFYVGAVAQNHPSIDSLQGALKKASSDTLRAKILCELCTEYGNIDGDTSLLYGKKGLALAEKTKEKKYIADCLFGLGRICVTLGFNKEAHINLERCAQINKNIGRRVEQALALNHLGNLYKQTGDTKLAFTYYQQSKKIREAAGDTKGLAGSLGNIGSLYFMQGKHSEALKYYQKSYSIFNRLGEQKSIAITLGQMGEVYWIQGNYPLALNYFQQALKISEKINNQTAIASASTKIGIIYFMQSDYHNALIYYQKSKKIQEELGNLHDLNATLTNIGLVYANKGDDKQALAYYEESKKVCEKINDRANLAKTLTNIGLIYTENLNDHKRALNYFTQSQKIFEALGDTMYLTHALLYIGDMYRKLSLPREGLPYNKRAIEYAHATGYKEALQDGYYARSKLDSASGDYASALKHYKLYVSYKDSLYNEEKTKEIGKLEAKYEIEKAQEAEKRKQEVEAKEIQRQNNLQYLLIFVGVATFFLGLFFIGRLKLPLILSEGLIFLAFLMLFEYILIVTEPFLEQYTGGVPIQKLGLNIVLAAIFTPLHKFLEGKLKKQLIKKEV